MAIDLNDTFISSLAEILVQKQISTENIDKYLSLVCKRFSFDYSSIYEIDQHNVLHLKEHCAHGTAHFPDSFGIDAIDPALRLYLAGEPLLHVGRTTARTPGEAALLDLFPAVSLVICTVVDENSRTNGFLVFANTERENSIEGEDLHLLQFAVNILEKNISVRVYQNKLYFAQNSLESILDNTGIDIYVNDFYNHDVLYANKSMAAPYGGKEAFMKNKCWAVLFPGQNGPCEFCPQKKLIDEEGNPTRVYSWDYQRPFDGSWFRVFSAAFRWVDGRLAHVVSSADITDNKRNEALIHYMANYDALTDLPNRRMLISECERRISRAHDGEDFYLLFFDIDGFKAINDNFGHDAGDEFLVELGRFFSSMPMLKGAVYRNGGDEFVALIGGGINEGHIRNLANFIHERFKKSWCLKKGEVFCNISIGVACCPDDGLTAEVLINKADQAMYHIKKNGGAGICFYHELP